MPRARHVLRRTLIVAALLGVVAVAAFAAVAAFGPGGRLDEYAWASRELYAERRALLEARLRGDRVLRDVEYVTRPGWRGAMDLYLPADSARPVPVVLYFHGGGWYAGSRELASLAAARHRELGYAVANISYRRTGEAVAPAAVQDARCALRWIAANGERLGIDTSRIVTVGASAGGHLALMAALARESDGFDVGCTGRDARAAAAVNWFGPTDLTRLMEHPDARGFTRYWLGDSADSPSFRSRLSPGSYARPDAPAIVTIHGDQDPLIPIGQARLLHERLEAAGGMHLLIEVPAGLHGFAAERTRQLADSALRFLRLAGVPIAAPPRARDDERK